MGANSRELLPDILAPRLDVVFVGAAPSLAAAMSGHYYAGPRNRFWDLLFRAGFTPRRLDAHEDQTVLRYGIGLTAVFRDRISTANELLPPPEPRLLQELERKLVHCAPMVVCYNGKDVYRMCTGLADPRWGLLPDRLGESLQYVVPSSSGRADRWAADRLYLFRELRQMIEALKMGTKSPETQSARIAV